MDYSLPVSSVHGILQARNPGVGCHTLLQGGTPDSGIKPASLTSPAFAGGARASVVAACGLSCPTACVIFLDQKVRPPHRQADSQPLDHQGSPSVSFLRVNGARYITKGSWAFCVDPILPFHILF